jgi:hypothetical protein
MERAGLLRRDAVARVVRNEWWHLRSRGAGLVCKTDRVRGAGREEGSGRGEYSRKSAAI